MAWTTTDNNKKAKLVRVDPCAINASPFCLGVGDSGLLPPRADLDPQQYKDAEYILQALGLNQPNCKVRRRVWADDFMANAHHYGDPLMQRWHPFLWQELKRLVAIP